MRKGKKSNGQNSRIDPTLFLKVEFRLDPSKYFIIIWKGVRVGAHVVASALPVSEPGPASPGAFPAGTDLSTDDVFCNAAAACFAAASAAALAASSAAFLAASSFLAAAESLPPGGGGFFPGGRT